MNAKTTQDDETRRARGDDPALLEERAARLEALGPRPPWWRVVARQRWDYARFVIMSMDVSTCAAWVRSVYGQHIAETAPEPPWWRPFARRVWLREVAKCEAEWPGVRWPRWSRR